ncbi:uncharacterized protein LOC110627531 [Manihot esculenta]|uniref:uncharacterized protein LOC110627531 n=1 Tax=Manihot esculenta TaxID=3983 RepID=UPI000B5D0E1E|nr:uncharacterized protein LOC110627531 [Manihot esculenta]
MSRQESSSSDIHNGNNDNGDQSAATVGRAPEVVESEGSVDPRSDRIALAAIFQGITEDTLLQLGAKKLAKEAWDALKVMNLGAERVKEVRAQALRWELESMKMEDGESVDEFTEKISTVVNKLRALSERVDETYVVKKMLHLVSSKYLQIASTIEKFENLSVKTIKEVTGSLKAHEERLQSYDSRGDEYVLLTKGEWKARAESLRSNEKRPQDMSRGWGRGRGRGRERGRGRGGRDRGRGPHGTGREQDDEEQHH